MMPVYEDGNPDCPNCGIQLDNAREYAMKASKVTDGFVCGQDDCFRSFVPVSDVDDQLDEVE